MIRLFAAPGTLVAGATLPLDDDEAHHAGVRRARDGDAVELLDGEGTIATALLRADGKRWSAEVRDLRRVAAPPELIVALGAGDRDRFLSVVQQCGELGITRLIPLETERSKQVETRMRDAAIDKARKRAREACKQSGNPWLPRIDDLLPFDALRQAATGARWFFGDPDGAPMPGVAADAPVAWAIGPEGGFTDDEVGQLRDGLGATGVWFGPHILRFETAAAAAALLTTDRRAR